MRVLENTASFKKDSKRPLVLALGNFDGIHRGHQKLLNHVMRQAKRLHGRAAVFTFREHPQAVLHPKHAPENLQLLEQRLELFRAQGIEVCFLQHFDRKFSSFSAREFVKKILVEQLGIKEICLGYNAHFGRDRQGDAGLLRTLGKEFGFKVFQANPVAWRGIPVSSTAVRAAVHGGEMKLAAQFLGRPWSLMGTVIRGASRGKKLGFATANLGLDGYIQPALGVYAVTAKLSSDKKLYGVANVGLRPTFGKKSKSVVEAHLFNFKKNIYGKKLEIFFVKHLRDEKKFESAGELRKQIEKDIQAARRVLKIK